jgi:oligoendopeptidase F
MFIANYEKDTTQNYMSNLKVVISGNKLEFYDFTHPIFFGRKIPRFDYDDDGKKIEKIPIVLSKDEKLLSSSRRAKKNIRRLICANAW